MLSSMWTIQTLVSGGPPSTESKEFCAGYKKQERVPASLDVRLSARLNAAWRFFVCMCTVGRLVGGWVVASASVVAFVIPVHMHNWLTV